MYLIYLVLIIFLSIELKKVIVFENCLKFNCNFFYTSWYSNYKQIGWWCISNTFFRTSSNWHFFNYWYLYKQFDDHILVMHTSIFGKRSPSCSFVENDDAAKLVLNLHQQPIFRWGTHLYMSLFPSICLSHSISQEPYIIWS